MKFAQEGNRRELKLTAPGARYELQQVSVMGIQNWGFRHGPKNLNDLYRKGAAKGDGLFVVSDARVITYSEAFIESGNISRALGARYGAHTGVRIGISVRNQCKWITAFIGVTSTGATAVLL